MQKPNNYLVSEAVGEHEIKIDSKIFTVLFDQYNSLGFSWKNEVLENDPHYFQKEDFIIDFQKCLESSLNGVFKHFLFDTSGSLAVEHAIHYSQLYTKRKEVLKFYGCYHGSTLMIKELNNHTLRVPHDVNDHVIGLPEFSYEHSIEEITNLLATNKFSCILIDPNFCDYFINPPLWYWQQLRAVCDRFAVLLVLDEMRTAFRSENIWFTNQLPIQIDIVAGAKALTNGLPFSLTGINEKIYDKNILFKVEEYCTGYSYNPFIIKTVRTIYDQLMALYTKHSQNIVLIKELAAKNSNDQLHIRPKGNSAIIQIKNIKSTLLASKCELEIKKKGILVYRAENKFVFYPHFTFPNQKLKEILEDIIGIINNEINRKKVSQKTK